MLRYKLRTEPKCRSVVIEHEGVTFYVNVKKNGYGYNGKIEFFSSKNITETIQSSIISKAIRYIKDKYKND